MGIDVVDSTSVRVRSRQVVAYAGFAGVQLAHSYEEPPEEFESVAEGWGRQETDAGDLYEGQFVAGLRCRTGRCRTLPRWRRHRATATGRTTRDMAKAVGGPSRDATGECYSEGPREKDLRHGKGISVPRDGSRFEGEYRDDWRSAAARGSGGYVGYFGEHRHGEALRLC